MRNLKLLLTTLLLTLVWGFSFSSASIPWNLVSSEMLNYSDCENVWPIVILRDMYSFSQISNYSFGCIYVYWPGDSIRWVQWNLYWSTFNWSLNLNFSWGTPLILCWDSNYLASYSIVQVQVECSRLQDWGSIFFDFYDLSNAWGSCSDCESSLNSCESTVSQLESDLNALSWNYQSCQSSLSGANSSLLSCQSDLSSCQSDLSTCTNSCDTMVSQCQENLSWCNEQLTSITNYANSLDQQLQQCLANWPNQDDCEWTWCNTLLTWNWNFNIFWNDNDNMFSLPVSNNIFLPRWYRGYVDSGVVAITEIEKTKIVFDDDSKSVINQTYYVYIWWLIFIFICSLFAYYLKKFVLMFFNWKYK